MSGTLDSAGGYPIVLISLITTVHIFVCVLLIVIVLLQQGRGADVGATFGGGSNTLFGASGADNLLSRVTTGCAMVFMITSVYLAMSMKPGAVAAGRLDSSIPGEAPISASAPIGLPQPPVNTEPAKSDNSGAAATNSAAENPAQSSAPVAVAPPSASAPAAPMPAPVEPLAQPGATTPH